VRGWLGRRLKRKEEIMTRLATLLKQFLADEQGLETVEYAVIAALITIAAIAAIGSVGTNVAAKFNAIAAKLQ
jgi:pilus assembly protein Flp/PilA